jgi:hypothetical protein
MDKKMNFDEVVELLKTERDYQDHMCGVKGLTDKPSVEGELVMLNTYLIKTMNMWTTNNNNGMALNELRKIAGITIRCLENHGCPKRKLSELING